MRQIEHQMDQANAAKRQQLQVKGVGQVETATGLHNIYMLNDFLDQEYSESDL